MTKSKLTHVLGVSLLVLAVALGAFVFLTHEFTALRGSSQERAQEKLQHEQRKLAEAALRLRVEETANERAELETYFLDFDDPARFLEEIEALGTRAGAVVTITAVGEKTTPTQAETPGVRTARIALTVEGSWTSCFTFLTLLERVPYALDIERLNIAKGTGEAWEGDMVLMVLGV